MLAEPVLARLRVKYEDFADGRKPVSRTQRDGVSIFLQPGNQKAVSTDSVSSISIRHSKAQAEYKKLVEHVKTFDPKLQPLYDRYTSFGKIKDKASQDKVLKQIRVEELEMREQVYGNYVRNNPNSPVAMYAVLQYAGWDINPDKAEPLFNSLSAGIKTFPSAIAFRDELEIAKKTGLGRVAMEFTQNDTLELPVSLSSFRGKYVLIDFWASWCGPCRAENPNIVQVFNKYRDRNFHIVGVSLDRPGQKEKWLKAIHDDGLAWTQVSDLKFWDNAVAKQYGIRAIPQNLLIDPSGKIIAKNIRGEDLELQVGEAIEGKKAF